MPPPLDERRPTMSPQLARRVAILGGIAFVLFAALFFRLWFLQVLSGESYVSQAAENRVRKVRIEAPRGNIVDRNGRVLVKTRQAAVVQLLPGELPDAELELAAQYGTLLSDAENERLAAGDRLEALKKRDARSEKPPKLTGAQRAERRRLKEASNQIRDVALPEMPDDPAVVALFRRLGKVLDLKPRLIHRRVIDQVAKLPYAAVTLKTDVGDAAFNYLLERQDEFPGVTAERQYLRSYPYDEVGAHLFGTLREIDPTELEQKQYNEVELGERIGKDGVEEAYDRFLRGQDGYFRQVIDALGQSCDDPVRCAVKRVDPQQGNQLELTLDLELQKAATAAIAKYGGGVNPGAFVAMDPRNGEILAMGSYPSFDANVFAKPISQKDYSVLNSEEENTPLVNRAIFSAYPTGSTFKLITGVAALEEGLITPEQIVDDPGFFQLGTQRFENAGEVVNGAINFVQALTVSSDVYFYSLGNDMYSLDGQVLQTWAKRLGLGRPTGLDIPGDAPGLVPDREWRDTAYEARERCLEQTGLEPTSFDALVKCGSIDRPYGPGDNVNLAVGQGDLQATPLQLAVAYATLANGGTVPRPHLGREVQDGQGRLEQKLRTPPTRKVDISDTTRDAILAGLRGAASAPNGTSSDVFAGVDLEVYGKTGTAERPPNADQSWYAAYVPSESRPIVVVTTIEEGGFGAETAAPAACEILTTWFDQSTSRCSSGASITN
ncbi:MAG: penicillin-binding protein 2 [Solirubrobacteraceae bacterium]